MWETVQIINSRGQALSKVGTFPVGKIVHKLDSPAAGTAPGGNSLKDGYIYGENYKTVYIPKLYRS